MKTDAARGVTKDETITDFARAALITASMETPVAKLAVADRLLRHV